MFNVTAAGVDFIEELRARADLDNAQLGNDQDSEGANNHLTKKTPPIEVKVVDDRSHAVRLLSDFKTLVMIVLGALAVYVVGKFLGIDL